MVVHKKLLRFGRLVGLLMIFALATTSCGKEIRDFFKAIEKYGYQSKMPLGKKTVLVDKSLLGGYVYNSLPVVISEKDKFTYQLTFLTVELDHENVTVDAFMSEVNGSRFLNIAMGETFAYLKTGVVINNELEIKLLKNSIEPYIKDNDLVGWIQKHGNKEEFTPENESSINIYYSFSFNKITVEKAYQIQTEQLHEKMVELFSDCKDYFMYDELEKRYPNEPLLANAREGIFNQCKSVEAYRAFVERFPNDVLAEKAKARIQEIAMFKADSVSFDAAAKQNTIDAYKNFMNNSSTAFYKDSATVKIVVLANAINENDIEWRWTGSSKTDAVNLIFNKIDYANEPYNLAWYEQHLTFYCLKMQQPDVTEKGLLYLDKLSQRNPDKNEYLNLYLSKGFLLWSLERIDAAVEVFKSKIDESFVADKPISMRSKLKEWYASFKDSDIVFPKEKPTWKKIKKL